MAKKNRKHQPMIRPKTSKRIPKMAEDGSAILCPFCIEPHPIAVDKEAACGTILTIEAVQTTYPGRAIECAVCGDRGGQFVKFAEGYRHATNCAPGVTYYDAQVANKKTNSLSASLFFNYTPDKFTIWWAKMFNRTPEQLKQVDKDGKMKEAVVGYAWKRVTNA